MLIKTFSYSHTTLHQQILNPSQSYYYLAPLYLCCYNPLSLWPSYLVFIHCLASKPKNFKTLLELNISSLKSFPIRVIHWLWIHREILLWFSRASYWIESDLRLPPLISSSAWDIVEDNILAPLSGNEKSCLPWERMRMMKSNLLMVNNSQTQERLCIFHLVTLVLKNPKV